MLKIENLDARTGMITWRRRAALALLAGLVVLPAAASAEPSQECKKATLDFVAAKGHSRAVAADAGECFNRLHNEDTCADYPHSLSASQSDLEDAKAHMREACEGNYDYLHAQ